jgi:hypothetical protein
VSASQTTLCVSRSLHHGLTARSKLIETSKWPNSKKSTVIPSRPSTPSSTSHPPNKLTHPAYPSKYARSSPHTPHSSRSAMPSSAPTDAPRPLPQVPPPTRRNPPADLGNGHGAPSPRTPPLRKALQRPHDLPLQRHLRHRQSSTPATSPARSLCRITN